MPYSVEINFLCRLKRRPQGFGDTEKLGKLKLGEMSCPMEGRSENLVVSHPANNVAGREAAQAFPERCSACNKPPDTYDFDIR